MAVHVAPTPHRRLRRLAAGREKAREDERTLIARELHDELGQSLTAIKLELTRTTQLLGIDGASPNVVEGLETIARGIDVAAETVRRLATSLRPPALDHLGLVAAIELEAEAIARRTGLRCQVVLDQRVPPIDAEKATPVYRIVQEALTNVVRHAAAGAIVIRLRSSARALTVAVQDNGRGMTDEQRMNPRALGLLGMSERAELLGGSLSVHSAPGRGTTVSLVIPRTAASGRCATRSRARSRPRRHAAS